MDLSSKKEGVVDDGSSETENRLAVHADQVLLLHDERSEMEISKELVRLTGGLAPFE